MSKKSLWTKLNTSIRKIEKRGIVLGMRVARRTTSSPDLKGHGGYGYEAPSVLPQKK